MLSAAQILLQFSRYRILVLGDLILDEYILGESTRISPEAPVPVLQCGAARYVLGGAANTAANVASLGGRVTLIGMLGENDDAANQIQRLCAAAGIRLVAVGDRRPTTRKVRVIGHQQQLLRLDYEQATPLDAKLEERVLERFFDEVHEADLVVISDYAKGLLTQRVCEQVIATTHALGKQVVIDPRPQHGSFYDGCDYMTPNWKESQALLGRHDLPMNDDAIEDTGRLLAQKFHCNVLLTLGPKGIAFCSANQSERFVAAAATKDVFDVSGAGDTVVAVFALAAAAGCTHRDAVTLANRAAGLVVARQGTATVTADQLIAVGDDTESRLIPRQQLRGLSSLLQARGARIVTVSGTFDLLHVGHLHVLREAKRLGDVVIVGVNSDHSVRLQKGSAGPVVPQQHRAEVLLALRIIDYVHIFDEPLPDAFLEHVRPALHVDAPADSTNPAGSSTSVRVHRIARVPVSGPVAALSRT